MVLKMGTVKYHQILNGLRDVEKWFQKKKVPLKGSRFLKIVENMKRLVSAYDDGTIEQYVQSQDYAEVVTAPVDALSFVNIHQAFGSLKDHEGIPKHKLIRIIGGPYLATDEDAEKNDNESRNTIFELELASTLKQRGLKIVGFDDVAFELEGATFFIECKRPLKESAISGNVEQAAIQLRKKMDSMVSGTRRGIIAIAVDKVMGADKGIVRADSPADLEQSLNRRLYNLVVFNREKYWRRVVDTRISAVMFFLNYVTTVATTNNISKGIQVMFDALINPALQMQDAHRIKQLEKMVQPR
jgi:hypothetical protein